MTQNPTPLRVLAAVDFSDASAAAIALAARLAGDSQGSLTVLHAESIEMPPYFTGAQIERLEAERREARAAAAEYLRAFAARHTAMPVDTVVADGPPVEAILGQAGGFDLVVVGTHGRRGARRWWLGSVAEAVVARSSVPVLITRANPELPPPSERNPV